MKTLEELEAVGENQEPEVDVELLLEAHRIDRNNTHNIETPAYNNTHQDLLFSITYPLQLDLAEALLDQEHVFNTDQTITINVESTDALQLHQYHQKINMDYVSVDKINMERFEVLENDQSNTCILLQSESIENSETSHATEKLSTCRICGLTFPNINLLAVHNVDKHFPCDLCGSVFSQKKYLGKHKKIHTGHPFTCRFCPSEFTTRSYLRAHLKTHEEDNKTYKCRYCIRKFSLPYLLKAHERAHTVEKAYEC